MTEKTRLSTCRYCDAPILWIKMYPSGKSMPCNPAEKSGSRKQRVVTEDGRLVMAGNGYHPHWRHCPNAPRIK